MSKKKIENVVGALALAISDDLLRAAQSRAPETAPAAAIALISHVPGMTIEQLRRALRLSHPGTVRLVDRLERDGFVARGQSERDGRAVALTLSPKGAAACRAILSSRQNALARALATLNPSDRKTLGRIAEIMLRAVLEDMDHALEICRLCDPAVCTDCPVVEELTARGVG